MTISYTIVNSPNILARSNIMNSDITNGNEIRTAGITNGIMIKTVGIL